MKPLFYLLTILALLAGLFFGYQLKAKYQTQLADTANTNQQASNVEKEVVNQTSERDKTRQERTDSLSERDELRANLELANSKGAEVKRDLARVEARKKQAQAELDEVNELIRNLEESVPGITLDELPSEIKRLTDKRNKMETQFEELELLHERLEKNVAKGRENITREQQLLSESRARVRQASSFRARVTSVNDQWGFVVVGAGRNDGLAGDSRLVVHRGNRYIGELGISNLESNVAITEVIPDSMKRGARILPGDLVQLANPTTN